MELKQKYQVLIKMKEEHDGGNLKDLKQHEERADPWSADMCGGFAGDAARHRLTSSPMCSKSLGRAQTWRACWENLGSHIRRTRSS